MGEVSKIAFYALVVTEVTESHFEPSCWGISYNQYQEIIQGKGLTNLHVTEPKACLN